ncbi:MAG: hypothetical protein IPH07_24330 [Deltaproteobacteria bacterium]|nr:hypothetical protein [Deltaproteobacteria bacterium]
MEVRGGIPSDPGAIGRWVATLRAERLCDTSRAIVDGIATLARDLAATDDVDTRIKLTRAIGELVSRCVAADKHAEALEIAALRKRSDAQRELAAELGGLH